MEAEKRCPYCLEVVAGGATRCPACSRAIGGDEEEIAEVTADWEAKGYRRAPGVLGRTEFPADVRIRQAKCPHTDTRMMGPLGTYCRACGKDAGWRRARSCSVILSSRCHPNSPRLTLTRLARPHEDEPVTPTDLDTLARPNKTSQPFGD